MMTRKLIAITPVILLAGIIAQLLLLTLAIVLYVPCLIWPGILNGPYMWITKGMARIMARSMLGRSKRRTVEESVS
jgi:hypothetical protein